MSDIEVKCPGCQRRLRLNEQLRGKAVRCPGCKTAFSLKSAGDPQQPGQVPQSGTFPAKTSPRRTDSSSPRPSASNSMGTGATWRRRRKMLTANDEAGDSWAQDPYSNSYDSSDDDPYSECESATLPGRLGRPARQSNSTVPWTRVISILLVVLGFTSCMVALALLAGPMIESLGSLAGHSLADDIALLPPETAGIVHIQIEDLLKHQNEYEFLRNNPLTQLHAVGSDNAEFSKTVRSITIAIPDASTKQNGMFPGSRAASMGAPFMVVRLNKAVSESELERQSGAKSELLEGKTVFRSRGSILCQFDSRTLLSGRESDILNSIKGIGNTGSASELKVPSSAGQLCFAIRTGQYAKFVPPMPEPQPTTPEALRNLSGLIKSMVSVRLASGAIRLDADGMHIHLEMELESPELAATMKNQIQILLRDRLGSLAEGPGVPAAISGISSVQKAVTPDQVTSGGKSVVIKTQLSKQQLREFSGQMPF